MKSKTVRPLIISVVLLLIIVGFVIVNSIYTSKSINEMIKQVKSLPDIPDNYTYEQIEKTEKMWTERKELYSAIIKFDFVYNFTKEISAAKAGCKAEDPGTYLSAKKSMINILNYIKDVQTLRLDNII